MDSLFNRMSDESYKDYFVRLFENKSEYGLTCSDIAVLLNSENNNNFGESTYRKYFAAFQDGRMYERMRLTADTGVATRILALSDFHFPFNLPLSTFDDYVGTADVLVLNGDLLDQQSISRFPKNYRIPPMEEMIGCRQYLIDLIEMLHPKKVIINKGNHEERFGAYLAKHLDSDMLGLMPDTALDLVVDDGFFYYDKKSRSKNWYDPLVKVFADSGIEIVYTGEWYCKVGKTIFAHPLTYSTGMLKTTEKAVDHFLRKDRDFDALVLGHTHKLGSYIQGDIAMYEQGCCCRTEELRYADGQLTLPQQAGFLIAAQDRNGNLLRDYTKLISLND